MKKKSKTWYWNSLGSIEILCLDWKAFLPFLYFSTFLMHRYTLQSSWGNFPSCQCTKKIFWTYSVRNCLYKLFWPPSFNMAGKRWWRDKTNFSFQYFFPVNHNFTGLIYNGTHRFHDYLRCVVLPGGYCRHWPFLGFRCFSEGDTVYSVTSPAP